MPMTYMLWFIYWNITYRQSVLDLNYKLDCCTNYISDEKNNI